VKHDYINKHCLTKASVTAPY